MKNTKKNYKEQEKQELQVWKLYQQIGEFAAGLSKVQDLGQIRKDKRNVAPLGFVEVIF